MEVILQNLTKKFPGRDRKKREDVIAVNDFSFAIPDGKLIGLLGPSGCGKSTTLNLISGLIKPTSGKIFFGKDDVTDLPPENRGIGLVFQNYALYPHLTVKQNILFPLQNLKGKEKLSQAKEYQKKKWMGFYQKKYQKKKWRRFPQRDTFLCPLSGECHGRGGIGITYIYICDCNGFIFVFDNADRVCGDECAGTGSGGDGIAFRAFRKESEKPYKGCFL